MFLQGIVFIALAISDVSLSLPLKSEKIDPVDLKYHCLHVKTEDGNHDKSPILLIHGLGASHRNWDGVFQVLALRTKRRVCAVDLRNHGDSPWSNRSDVAALVTDIGHFLDKQKIKKVNIIGHSLGGKTGVHYALTNPGRVDSLVVEDMRPNGVTQTGLDVVKGLLYLVRQSIEFVPKGVDEDEAKRAIIRFIIKKMKEMGSTETIDENAGKQLEIRLVNGKWQWKMNLDVLEKDLKNNDMLTESKGLYPGPVLFIYGKVSPFAVGEDKENILKLFPKAKLVPVERAGHIIHGQFHEFDDEVIKFLNEIN